MELKTHSTEGKSFTVLETWSTTQVQNLSLLMKFPGASDLQMLVLSKLA